VPIAGKNNTADSLGPYPLYEKNQQVLLDFFKEAGVVKKGGIVYILCPAQLKAADICLPLFSCAQKVPYESSPE